MPINFPLISVNGAFDAAISPLDRGFAYGDGLFETCRYSHGVIPLWHFHRERLLRSAERLGIPLNESQLNQYLNSILTLLLKEDVPHATIKISLTRGEGGRGYRLPDRVVPTYCVGAYPCDQLQSAQFINGVSVRVCTLRLSQSPALAGMKHLNRLEHILARAEWQDEFAEGILLDSQGHVVEATVSNLFAVKAGVLYTPDLSAAGVAGVARQTIIEMLAPAIGFPCLIAEMDLDFLRSADEIFLCNSVYGIWPVTEVVDNRQSTQFRRDCFSNHSVTRRLQAQFATLFEAQP